MDAGADVAEDGIAHLHEREGEEKGEDLNGDAENNAENVGGTTDDDPAGKLRGGK